MGHAMKKLLTISVAIMFAFGSVRAEDNFDIQIQLLDNEIERLTAEKQRQFSDLDRCASRVSGFRIAGISLLGLTAVGIGVNVYQRVQINRADFERCELERMRRPNPDTFKCDWDNSRNRWIIIDAPIVIEPVVTIPVLPTEVITETQETETTQVQTPTQQVQEIQMHVATQQPVITRNVSCPSGQVLDNLYAEVRERNIRDCVPQCSCAGINNALECGITRDVNQIVSGRRLYINPVGGNCQPTTCRPGYKLVSIGVGTPSMQIRDANTVCVPQS